MSDWSFYGSGWDVPLSKCDEDENFNIHQLLSDECPFHYLPCINEESSIYKCPQCSFTFNSAACQGYAMQSNFNIGKYHIEIYFEDSDMYYVEEIRISVINSNNKPIILNNFDYFRIDNIRQLTENKIAFVRTFI